MAVRKRSAPRPGSAEWDALIERGLALAHQATSIAWFWADLALDACGPIGEPGQHTGAKDKAQALIDDIAQRADASGEELELPSAVTLILYRSAAEAIPPARRAKLSIGAGRILALIPASDRFAIMDEMRDNGIKLSQSNVQSRYEQYIASKSEEQDERPYSDWSVDELREECNARGLPALGDKNTLVKALTEDDEAADAEQRYKESRSKSSDADNAADQEAADEEDDEEADTDSDEEEEATNEELAKLAATLAKQGRTAQEIAGELLMTVKAIALNGEVAEAIRAVNPDAMSWINYGSVMCATATPPEIIDSIDFNVERVFGPMYDLNTADRKTLQTIADRINKELKKYGKSKAPR